MGCTIQLTTFLLFASSTYIYNGEMNYRLITLTQGQFAKVDEEDHEALSKFKWHAIYKPHGKCFYAGGYPYGGNKGVRMHNFLMQPPPGLCVDHVNRDTLDNRKENLRIVTHSENCLNRIKPNKSGVPGLHKQYRRYLVRTIGIIPARCLGTAGSIEEGIAMQRAAGCPV